MRARAPAVVTLLVGAAAGCGYTPSSFEMVCNPGPSVSGDPSPLATAGREYGACLDGRYISSWVIPIVVSGLELSRAPAGAQLSGGCVAWTPSDGDVGATRSFEVSTPADACGDRARKGWTVRVLPPLVLSRLALDRAALRPGERATVVVDFSGGQASWDFGPLTSGAPASTPPLWQSVTLAIRVWNDAGAEERRSQTIEVLNDAAIQRFRASPEVVTAGDPVYLSWEATDATEYVVRPDVGPPLSTTATAMTVSPVVDTTYVLEARNALGAATAQLSVHVVPAPRVVSFTADPPAVALGGSTTLRPVFEHGTATLRRFEGLLDVGTIFSSADLGNVASGAAVAGGTQQGTDTYELVVTNALGRTAVARLVVPATGPGTFAYTGAPPTDRPYGPALVATGGDGVLLVGGDRALPGWNGTAAIAQAAPDVWTLGPEIQLRSERFSATAALLADGRVLVAGGNDFNGATWYEAEVIDLAARTTTGVGAFFWSRQPRPSVVPLDDGDALVVGMGAPRRFDPLSSTLVEVGTDQTRPGPTARACRLADGRVLATGSAYGDGQPRSWIFEPASGTFAVSGDPVQYRAQPVVLCLREGGALVAGGMNALGRAVQELETYDAATGTFHAAGTIADVPSAALQLLDGRVLLVGSSPHLLDLTTGELSEPGRPIFRWGGSSDLALLPDGRVVIAAGGVPAPEVFTP